MQFKFLASVMLLSVTLDTCRSAKILNIAFMSSKSHKIVYTPLLNKLASLGHEITIVNPLEPGAPVKNIVSHRTVDMEDWFKKRATNMYEIRSSSKYLASGFFNPFIMMTEMLGELCAASYDTPIIQQILKEKYDLILFPPLFNDCLYGLIHKLQAPVVIINQGASIPWHLGSFGVPSPPSFVTSFCFHFSHKMSYLERVINFLGSLQNYMVLNWYYFPKMEQIYRKALNDPTLPGIAEIERNSSLILINTHVGIEEPRPLLADTIEVGGMALTKAKPLPKDLLDFADGSGEHGFIYFSMGSALKGSDMPEKFRTMFVKVFAKLKQRVIWKWETESMADAPANLKLSKWLPQQDVLGHPKCRLFITHGGHGGSTEAAWHGVPLLGIPMFGDQANNMEVAIKLGIAQSLEFSELSEDLLSKALNEMLTNEKYATKAKELSKIYQDNLEHPLERATFWVEYVLRHKGAPHLRSAGRDLNVFQYYCVDVVLGLAVAMGLMTYISCRVLRCLLRKCFGKKPKEEAKRGKKNN